MERMTDAIARAIYFLGLIKDYILCRRDKTCPFCGSPQTRKLTSKFFFEKLLRCDNCGLMFRYPKEKITVHTRSDWLYYYESRASILPKEAELAKLKKINFKSSTYDISDKIAIIKKYINEGKILDYGSSWGYGLWQFMREGFRGMGYEISAERVEYGQRNLGLEIIHNPEELDKMAECFDVVFADNVLEHIGDIKNTFDRIYKLLKKGGYFYFIIPDCSDIDTERDKWKKVFAFGKKHCIAFDKAFLQRSLPSMGFSIVEIKEYAFNLVELRVIAMKQ